MNIEGTFNGIFGVIHNITDFIRSQVIKAVPDYATLVIILISVGLGYWLDTKYPGLLNKLQFLWLGLIVFLILKFV